MNIAFFFNSDHPILGGGWYGGSVMRRILETGVLQNASRHMRVGIGDILTYGHVARRKTNRTMRDVVELNREVYHPIGWDRLLVDRLEDTYDKATVYCWLFQNMTPEIAELLHAALVKDESYVGAMEVDFSTPLHLVFFRNGLIERYRLQGRLAAELYHMGENDDPDMAVKEIFEENGFTLAYEDMGARHTFFDSYDTLEHFRRVKAFERVFGALDGWSEERTSDVTFDLEELHPQLFDILAAAARTLERAETAEDLAQAALSGRRFLEHLADMLFPPQAEPFEGHAVGPTQHKNRLWAYVKTAMTETGSFAPEHYASLGKECDRLFDLVNSGLHSKPTTAKVSGALADLAAWTHEVLRLNPDRARKPYLAYDQKIQDFLLSALKDDAE